MAVRILVAGLLLWSGPATAQTLNDARGALRENRVAEAERMLAAIIASPAISAPDQARALRLSSRIAWRIDQDAVRALAMLDRVPEQGEEACDTAQARARLLREARRSEELLGGLDMLIARCAAADQADAIRIEGVEAALDAGQAGRAQALLGATGEEVPTSMRGSSLRLRLALTTDDAAGALRAWRDYFWLGDGDMPQGVEARHGTAAEIFAKGLASGAPVEHRLHLVDLLVRAGFAAQAELYAGRHGLAPRAAAHPLWIRAAAYFEARREFAAAELAANRRLARGGGAPELQAAYDRMTARLAATAGGTGEAADMVRAAYGLHGTSGLTGGFPSVHLGHVMQSERQAVEQYGKRATIEFIAIDNMIANGFQSWLWDGEAQTGGWTSEGPVIVQIRSAYTSGPIGGWRIARDGPDRQRLLDRQAERAAQDLAAAAGGRAVTLPGMGDRLRLQTAAQILARAEAASGGGGALKRAFLDEYWRASVQQSITIHEGRHAIDQLMIVGVARMVDDGLEYRAKLSELALADYPRMALYNIVNANVADGTSHGDANARVMREYAAWIDAHRGEVAGFDAALPAMVQIDRLTDDQLRVVARGLDPLAKSTSKEKVNA